MKKLILLAVAAATLFTSCKKNNNVNVTPSAPVVTPQEKLYNVIVTDSIIQIQKVLTLPVTYTYKTYRVIKTTYVYNNYNSADSCVKAVYKPLDLNKEFIMDGLYVTETIYGRIY